MPTDEENNAATPQYITSNDLIGVKIPTFSWDEPDLPQAFKKFRRYCEILLSTPTYSRKTGKEQVSLVMAGTSRSGNLRLIGISLKLTSKTQRKSGMHSPHTLSPNLTLDSLAISYEISSKKKKNQWTVLSED